jgi:hypothetical protein
MKAFYSGVLLLSFLLRHHHCHGQLLVGSVTDKVALKLVDAKSNSDVFDLFDGAVVSLAALGLTKRSFNIRAQKLDNAVLSVRFLPSNRLDSTDPFTYCKYCKQQTIHWFCEI